MALLGLIFAGYLVADRAGLPGEFDATAPFRVGTQWGLVEAIERQGGEVTAEAEIGYDGQWFLGHAYDPLLRSDLVTTFDRPQYRSMRPMLPFAGWVLAAGNATLIPYALLLASILAVAVGVAATARIALAHHRSRWWGLLFVAVPGVMVGLQYGTAEPMGLALAVLGLALVLDRRFLLAGVAFAGAALTKETYLGFAAMVVLYLAVTARFRGRQWFLRSLAVGVPPVAALGAWWLYVSMVVPPSQRTPNHLLQLPFEGWLQVFSLIARGEYPTYPTVGPISLTVSFLVLVAALVVVVWRRKPDLLAFQVVLWSGFGIALVHIMLERYLSSQRVLGPVVLVAALFLVTAWPWGRDRERHRPPATEPAVLVSAGSDDQVGEQRHRPDDQAGEQ